MEWQSTRNLELPFCLLEAIRSLPIYRSVAHCGETFQVPSFDMYADCPRCGARIKARSFAANSEIEDLFDAVFEWMNQPGAEILARRRQQVLQQDQD